MAAEEKSLGRKRGEREYAQETLKGRKVPSYRGIKRRKVPLYTIDFCKRDGRERGIKGGPGADGGTGGKTGTQSGGTTSQRSRRKAQIRRVDVM